jgi:hypothetical protein
MLLRRQMCVDPIAQTLRSTQTLFSASHGVTVRFQKGRRYEIAA